MSNRVTVRVQREVAGTVYFESVVIGIVGIGALGSHVALFLRNEGLLRLVDFDRIEPKNTLAQQHSRADIGRLKAACMVTHLQHHHEAQVTARTNRLTADNEQQLLGGCSLLIDCTDNREARELIQGFARRNNIPCLHGALAADGAYGRAIWTKDFRADDADGAATCEGGEHLPFIALVSSYCARAAQIFLRTQRQVGYSISPDGKVVVV